MRCDASELCAGNCENAFSWAPVGGPLPVLADALPSASTAKAATAALTQRRAGCFVEEMQVAGVDCDADVVAEPELYVRRERGDEVRPRPDDALGVLVRSRERLVDRVCLALDLPRVDLEVRHRLAAEGLDELDPRLDVGGGGAALRGIESARPQTDEDVPSVVRAQARVQLPRVAGGRQPVPAELD